MDFTDLGNDLAEWCFLRGGKCFPVRKPVNLNSLQFNPKKGISDGFLIVPQSLLSIYLLENSTEKIEELLVGEFVFEDNQFYDYKKDKKFLFELFYKLSDGTRKSKVYEAKSEAEVKERFYKKFTHSVTKVEKFNKEIVRE